MNQTRVKKTETHPWIEHRRGRTCEACGRTLPTRAYKRHCATCIKIGQFRAQLFAAIERGGAVGVLASRVVELEEAGR